MILEEVSFELGEKELVMALGLNGAGKTTLLKTIVGLIIPEKGTIYFDGMDSKTLSFRERAKKISYIPQTRKGEFSYSVLDFVLMGITPQLDIFELPGKEKKQEAEKALEKVGILHLKNAEIDKISGGEKHMAYLARTMMQRAEYMIMDEPTASLDYKRQYEFLSQLRKYLLEEKLGAFISVHDPNLALKFADRVIFIHKNKIWKEISRKENNFARCYLDIINSIYENKLEMHHIGSTYFISWKEE